MERILVGLQPGESKLWAGIHALNLAKRINAEVSFLLVMEPGNDPEEDGLKERQQGSMMKSLGPLIEQGRSEGIRVDYYVTHGKVESELVRFIRENKITMLVVGSSFDPKDSSGIFGDLLEKIRHRIDCRIEVVYEKDRKAALKRRR